MAHDCFIVCLSSLGVALCLYRMKVGCCLREIAIAAAYNDAEHYVPFRILSRIHNNKRTLILKEFVSWWFLHNPKYVWVLPIITPHWGWFDYGYTIISDLILSLNQSIITYATVFRVYTYYFWLTISPIIPQNLLVKHLLRCLNCCISNHCIYYTTTLAIKVLMTIAIIVLLLLLLLFVTTICYYYLLLLFVTTIRYYYSLLLFVTTICYYYCYYNTLLL